MRRRWTARSKAWTAARDRLEADVALEAERAALCDAAVRKWAASTCCTPTPRSRPAAPLLDFGIADFDRIFASTSRRLLGLQRAASCGAQAAAPS